MTVDELSIHQLKRFRIKLDRLEKIEPINTLTRTFELNIKGSVSDDFVQYTKLDDYELRRFHMKHL